MHLPLDRLLKRIKPTDRVLDLGGWKRVFPRANVVADLLPYETRKVVHPDHPEYFTEDTWIVADFCSPTFWDKIDDKSFDFIIISHTLEDIRDPLYVCSQLVRCGKAGYIESPSKFRECAKISADARHSGYAHHRWIITPNSNDTGLIFKAKLAWAHSEDYLGDERRHYLRDFYKGFNGYFWTGAFSFVEHFPKGMELESKDLAYFYSTYPYDKTPKCVIDLKPNSTSPNDGRCLFTNEYKLPHEIAKRASTSRQCGELQLKKPSLLLHAGMHKTGTSSIQASLYVNQTAINARGVCYPLANGQPPNHNFLVALTRGMHPPRNLSIETKTKISHVLTRIQREAARHSLSVVSSEEFSTDFASPVRAQYWAETLSEMFDIKILYYLRRPDEFQESVYAEIVKGWYRGTIQHAPIKANYLERLRPAIEAFGLDRIRLRPFQKAHWRGASLLSDFAAELSLDGRLLGQGHRNVSLPRRKTLFLSLVDKTKIKDKKLFLELLKGSTSFGPDEGNFLMSPQERKMIYMSVREDNSKLLKKFGWNDVDDFFGWQEPDEDWRPPGPIMKEEIAAFRQEIEKAAGTLMAEPLKDIQVCDGVSA